MILVLCGTQKQDFSRMINAVEQLANKYEITVQGGHNKYKSNNMIILEFVTSEELKKLYQQADYIITHAGAASMIQALQSKKKTIAFPRLSKYGEHVNDHQLELASKLEDLGYLLVYRDGDNLKELFEKAKQFIPKSYQLNGNIISLIDADLSSLKMKDS